MKIRILLVENDLTIVEKLSALLAAESFNVDVAMDGESGLAKSSQGNFDLMILDADFCSGKTGFAVCDELRRKGVDTSILMLTARGNAEERIAGLRLGADDCVPRSCDANELVARVEALLRRLPRTRRSPSTVLRFGDVVIDFAIPEARKGRRLISLASKEFRLLQYLADHRERVVTRKEILKAVWEYDSAVSSRTIDVHVGWLRQKLEDNPQNPRYIKTIRGRGYRFDSDEQLSKPLLTDTYFG